MNAIDTLRKELPKINEQIHKMNLGKFQRSLRYPLEATARTALYFLPAMSTQVFLRRKSDAKYKDLKHKFSFVEYLKEVKKLYEQDAENIKQGYYMAPEHMLPAMRDYTMLNLKNALDLFHVRERMKKNDTKVADETISPEDFPAYYRQSFHFQSDGYLSDHSAQLYDHQVEMVFTGTAEAMRRHGLKAIALLRGTKYPNDEKLKILDVGCGTGSFTHELKRHFPLSEVTGMDLSPWYLKEAQHRYPHSGIEWKSGKAEKLPFDDNSFDVVTSVFLFHELPERVRTKAAQEMLRVLKPGGSIVHVDSLQLEDVPHLDASLEIFPQLYHEPYYQNYITHKTEKKFDEAGLTNIASDYAFYSKIVRGEKSLEKSAVKALSEEDSES